MANDGRYNPKGKHVLEDERKSVHGQEDYHFIKEVIKDKPVSRGGWLKKAGVFVGAATIFGVIVAVTFSAVVPLLYKDGDYHSNALINIPNDNQPEEIQETIAADGDSKDNEVEKDIDDVIISGVGSEIPLDTAKEEMSLTQYKQVYKEMVDVSKSVDNSLVTVIGITQDVDWFNNSYENQGQTAGIVVADNRNELYILTEYRIIEKADRILVTFAGENSVDAKYQKHDSNTGLTILKVNKSDISGKALESIEVAKLGNSYEVEQGEPVIAMGNPMGYSHSIAYGIITSVANKISKVDTEYSLLTTDILGSSGGSGILINLEGEIIGVIAQDNNVDDNKNIITAYAVSELKSLIGVLSNRSEIIYLGIKGQNVTEDIALRTGIPKGIYINSVESESPALNSGIQTADVIVKIGDYEVENLKQYKNEISRLKGGQKVTVTVMREGSEGYVEIPIDVLVEAL